MSQIQDQIVAYLNSLGKEAAKTFNVTPQKVAAWKRKPASVPFAVIETSAEWAADQPRPLETTYVPPDPNNVRLSRHDWGEPEKPEAVITPNTYPRNATEAVDPVWDHLNDLNDRMQHTESGIAAILNLLQNGPQPVRTSPSATTQRLEPQVGPNGELPAFVSSGPQQAATDNLTRPSRFAGRPMTEADLDRIDPTRHNPAVDPAHARALWMRPKILPARK